MRAYDVVPCFGVVLVVVSVAFWSSNWPQIALAQSPEATVDGNTAAIVTQGTVIPVETALASRPAAPVTPTGPMTMTITSVPPVRISETFALPFTLSNSERITLDNVARVATSRILRSGQPAWSVAFSPDGARLATGGNDGLVRLWRVADGVLLRALVGHAHSVWAVAFSPDGSLLASGGDDGTIRLWAVADGSLLRTLEGHTAAVLALDFSPDGHLLASGSADDTIRLWQVADGAALRTLEGHGDSVWNVAFSPNGQALASTSEDGMVRLWGVKP